MSDELREAKPRFYTDYSKAPRPRRLIRISPGLIATITILLVLACLWYSMGRRLFPYGSRQCWLPCFETTLRLYAGDHDGWYPSGGATPLQSLQLLYTE